MLQSVLKMPFNQSFDHCKLESCGKEFLKTRRLHEFCSGECRGMWNHNHYCGHGLKYSECEVAGCEGRMLSDLMREIQRTLGRCACGVDSEDPL